MLHLVWPFSDLTYGLDVVLAHMMPRVVRFVPAPSSCASAPISVLGFGRLLLSANGLLADLPWWLQRDRQGVLS